MQNVHSSHPLSTPSRGQELTTLISLLVMLWAVLAMVGCSKQSETGNAAESTAVATPPPPPPMATAAPLNDGNMIAALSEGDSAEITLAKLAIAKSKSPQVKGFARMMVRDHSKMKAEKADLAKKLNITPQPPANDAGPAHLTAELSALNAASTPRAFDSTYINQAVQDHTDALATVKDFETKATAPQLKAALAKAEPIVQHHLDRAKAIQQALAKRKYPPLASQQKMK